MGTVEEVGRDVLGQCLFCELGHELFGQRVGLPEGFENLQHLGDDLLHPDLLVGEKQNLREPHGDQGHVEEVALLPEDLAGVAKSDFRVVERAVAQGDLPTGPRQLPPVETFPGPVLADRLLDVLPRLVDLAEPQMDERLAFARIRGPELLPR